jgi:hypothetical protein
MGIRNFDFGIGEFSKLTTYCISFFLLNISTADEISYFEISISELGNYQS